jgi:hypothetical protein
MTNLATNSLCIFFQIDILVNKCHVDSTGKATMGTHRSSDHPTLPSGFHVGKTMP